MGVLNPICNVAQRVTLRAFADWKVQGRENVPPAGPLIIVANHQSNFDPTLLSASIPRLTTFLAKSSLFKPPVVAALLRSYGAFPLDRDGSDIRAYRWALSQLKREQAIVVFPEGTRSRGGMRKAQPGVARLALMSHASLLPVGMTGTERFKTWLRAFNPTGKLTVNIGPAFTLPEIAGKPDKQAMASLTDMMMERIAALLPADYQGAYKTGAAATAPDR